MTIGRAVCEFRADDVLIRPWRQHDPNALFEAASESIETVGRWLPWCHENYTRTESEAWVEHCLAAWDAGDQYAFAILAPDEPRVLGGVGLNKFNVEQRTANLGYWIRTIAQNRGIATRAVKLIGDFGFQRGFARLEISAALNNIASRRVAEKSGAQFQYIERGRIQFRDERLDAAIYALRAPQQNAA